MGRFKSDKAPTQPVQFPTTPTGSPLPQQQMQMGGMPQQQGGFPQQQMGQYNPQDWVRIGKSQHFYYANMNLPIRYWLHYTCH